MPLRTVQLQTTTSVSLSNISNTALRALPRRRFVTEMPNARLVWVEECGHVPHLEQPDETARAIMDFVKKGNPEKVRTELGQSCLHPAHILEVAICTVGASQLTRNRRATRSYSTSPSEVLAHEIMK